MLSVSERFKKAFEQVDKPRKIKAIVTLKNVSYENDQLFHVEYNSEAISGDTFAIGSTFSNNIKVTIDKVVEGIKQQDQLTYQLGIVVEPNETELADMKSKGYTWDVIEYVPMGTFFVTSYNPDRNENRTIIEASDSMSFLESTYSSNLTYPAYLKDIALDVANKNGLVVDSGSLSRLPQIQIKRPEKVSYRQVLGIVAQYQKGFATFDRQNRLAIRALNDPKYTVSTNNYFLKGLVKEELLYKVDGISCKVEKEDQTTVLQAGKTTGNQIVLENSSMTQIDLNTIFSGLSTLNYYPYSLKWRGNPALEVGDWISLNDIKTNSFKVPNLSYKLTFSGGLTAESSAHTKSISETTVQYRGPLNQKIEDITGWISAAGGFSYTGLDEPQNPKEKDVWFKPNGPDTELWIFENGKWKLETSTADVRELSEAFEESNKKIEQAEKDLAQAKLDLTQNGKDIEQNKLDILDNIAKTTAAKTELDQAKADLVIAAGKIDSNKTYMDQVKAQADEIAKQTDDATTIANLSKIIADEAKNASDTANKNADAANKLSSEAKTSADQAKKNAEQALNDASSAVTNANQAKSNASTALTNANQALMNAANVDQKVKTEVSRIDGELSSKASQTTVDTLNKTVSNHTTQITQNQNDIKIKANQSAVDTLNQTVSNQGTSIEANAKAISFKASQTDVNAISGRVSSAESSIKVNADSIKNLVTKTDGTNTKVTSLEQNVDGFKQTVAERFDNQIVGGDNLIFNSGDFVNLDGWTFDVASNVTSGSWSKSLTTHPFWYNSKRNIIKSDLKMKNGYGVQAYLKSKRFEIQKNATYTLTLTAFNNSALASVDMYLFLRQKGSKDDFTRYFAISKGVKYRVDSASAKSFTFNTPDMEENEAYLRIDNNGSLDDTSTASFFLCEAALRQGNIVQNWSPSAKETNNRVSTVEQNIDGFKQTVAQTYSTKDELNTTNTKISTLEQNVNGFKQTVAQTYSTKGELSTTNTKVTALEQNVNGFKQTVAQTYSTKEQVNNLKPSGNNLLYNSGNFRNLDGWRSTGNIIDGYRMELYLTTHPFWYESRQNIIRIVNDNTSEEFCAATQRFDIKKNTTYTLTITAFNDADVASCDLYVLAKKSTDTTSEFTRAYTLASNFVFGGSLVTKSYTFTTADMEEDKAYVRIDNNGSKKDKGFASVYVCEVAFHEGNMEQPWMPSINESLTKVSTLEQDVNGFKQTVSDRYETKDGVSTKVNVVQSDLNSYKNSVSSTYETKSGVKTQVTEISSELGTFKTTVGQTYTTKDEFGNIVVAGDNIIPDSGDFQNLDNWRTAKGGGFSGNFNWNLTTHEFWYNKNRKLIGLYSTSTVEAYLISSRFPVKQNTTYTIGITAFNSSNLISSDLYVLARESTNTSKDFTKAIAVYENAKFSTSEASTKYVTFTTPKMSENEAYIRIDHNGTTSQGTQASLFICEVSMREGNVKAGWTPATGNEITQIKQTINTIDLNVVKKDKVVSSINLNPEGIRLKGSLIYLDGTSYIANGVITNAHIADATITSASIADLAVTTAKIAKLAITDALIANATITAASIADLAITSAKIGNLAVTNAKIGDLAVNGAKIANAAITEAKIGDAAIVNAHIKDATIESAKIKSINAEKITAGTLNAANVNIINLNANNITTGDLTGINITGSTITSQKGSSKIVLDGGALSWYTSNGIVGSIYTTEENYENFANWDVYDNGYFSIRGKGTRDGETYMRYGWGELKSIVSGMVSIISKNKYADRSTSLELNNSQVILKAGSGSGSSYRQGQIQVGAYGTSVTGGMTISGGLSVTGSKNAIHQVDGQWYATPAYETAESYLGDIGSTTTNNDSMVLISIDNLFGRIVNTSLEYQVFVSSYGSGHVWVEKRMQNAFVVRSSEPNTKFAWEIKAKRKGYEQERLVKHSLIA